MKEKIGEIEIAFDNAGAGEPVVLLHGHPFNRSMWRQQTKVLQEKYRVFTPDLRGYGESSLVENISRMSDMARDVNALLDFLKLEKVVLGGLSMGGYAALEFYNLFPERVRALVLADTKAAADAEEARKKRFETAEKAEKEGMKIIADTMLSQVLAPETLENKPEVVERVRQMIFETNPAGAAAALRGMAERSDHTNLLSKIGVPTLIIVGEKDSLTPPAEAEKMHQAIKNSQLVRITAAGHLSPLENPKEFNQALLSFLGNLND